MDFLPIIFLLLPLFLSPLYYSWPVILGFLSTIILVPSIVIYTSALYDFLFLENKDELSDDLIGLFQVDLLFILPGIPIYFIFIIPVYNLLAKRPYDLPLKYSFPAFVS